MLPQWKGLTVVCIASGPSLTRDDCALVEKSRLPTLAVNSSWQWARFAQVIYAGDEVWWKNYGPDIDIPAQRWTGLQSAGERYGVNVHGRYPGNTNSGARAIEFAMEAGADRVLLLGFDCSVKNGTHCHGDHKRTKNPDAARCQKWLRHFADVQKMAVRRGIEIINCSRETAITSFNRMPLPEALQLSGVHRD